MARPADIPQDAASPSAGTAAEGRQPVGARAVLWLVGLSLGVRLAGWLWVVRAGVRPLVDEAGYFLMAGGWAEVLQRLAQLSAPSKDMAARAWQGGGFLPFHPFLLGASFLLPGDDLATARLLGVIVGAATTALVVLLTARLAGRRAACAAGAISALYPSFVFFSVSLWSEGLFNLLLLALLLMITSLIDRGGDAPGRWIAAMGGGTGLLLLTRAAALPMALALLGWLAWRLPRERRLRTAGGAALIAGLLVLPWSVANSLVEKRPVLLSSMEALNLALGNNPWTPPSLGSAWGVPEYKIHVLKAAHDGKRYQGPGAVARGYSRAGEIARREILGHPLRTAHRVVVRGAQLVGLDFFPLRHLATATLPPLPGWTLGAGLIVQWLSLALLLFLIAVGIVGPGAVRHRSLLLAVVAAGSIGPLATVSVPRFALPLLAVLTAAAGHGWTRLREGTHGRSAPLLAVVAALALALPIATVRQSIEHHLGPSSRYATALAPFASAVGAAPVYTDMLACRPPADAAALPDAAPLAPETARWLGEASLPMRVRSARGVRYLGLEGSKLEPAPIALRTGATGGVALTAAARWHRFLPVDGTGVSCSWEGAVFPRPELADADGSARDPEGASVEP
jgi:4-amino-4-deoxy-L-arabinose transferase-like glycosyltransferase